MKIQGRRGYLWSLESVAMTDIVLNMFIFFFISFSLVYTFSSTRVQRLEVKLPKAANTSPAEGDQATITLTNEGIMYLDNDYTNLKDLRDRLAGRLKQAPSLSVVVRADRLVAFKHVVAVLDMISGLGITRLSIATVKE